MEQKVIFFDIDGTLIDFGGEFPESAKDALQKAKDNGHKIFICSGRSKCQIEKRLLDFGFDGYVCAAGAYVEYEGNVIFEHHLTSTQLDKLFSFFNENNIIYMLQCTDRVISTRACFEEMFDNFKKRMKGDMPKNISKIFESQEIDDNIANNTAQYKNAEKVCYYKAGFTYDKVNELIGSEFDVTAMSFKSERDASGEITVAGVTKALGMRKLIEFLGKTREETVAFGDGPNDFEMLEYAGIGVAMGNASDDLKATADIVTTNIGDNGIFNGLKKLGLI